MAIEGLVSSIAAWLLARLTVKLWAMSIAAFFLVAAHQIFWPQFFAETGTTLYGRITMAVAAWVLASIGVNEIAKAFAGKRSAASAKTARLNALESLSEPEKEVLRSYVAQGVRALQHRSTNASVLRLVAVGVLRHLPAAKSADFIIAELDSDVLEELKRRPEILVKS